MLILASPNGLALSLHWQVIYFNSLNHCKSHFQNGNAKIRIICFSCVHTHTFLSTRSSCPIGRPLQGPCVYRELHWHAEADENLFVISAETSITTALLFPNDTAITLELKPNEATMFPQGFTHSQFNPSCNQSAELYLNWNSANPTNFELISNLQAASQACKDSAFIQPLPSSAGTWVIDIDCAKRCGMNL